MAAQCLNDRGAATLAIIGLLTLLALGGALLALRIPVDEAAELRLTLETQRLELRLESALLHLLRTPGTLDGFMQPASPCRIRLEWPRPGASGVTVWLDRCRESPGRVRLRLEAGQGPLRRHIGLQIERARSRWRIIRGSWHDFDA